MMMEICEVKKTTYRLYTDQIKENHPGINPIPCEIFVDVFGYLVNFVSGGNITKENVHSMLGRAMILAVSFTADMEKVGWDVRKLMLSKVSKN